MRNLTASWIYSRGAKQGEEMKTLLTVSEHQDAFKKFVKDMKHAKVNEALSNFLYDNSIISRGTTLGYAKLKSVDPDGTVILEPCPELKFSVLNVELLK